MKVRILDVHEDDAYFHKRDKIIGMMLTDIFNEETKQMMLTDIFNQEGLRKEISIGDKLRNTETGNEYIVASPDPENVVLINLGNGMRWAFKSVPAADVVLTKDEVIGLIGSDHLKFWEKIANAEWDIT